MSIQLLNGLILLNGGSIATHADCCCDDPCIECNPCPTCWTSLDDPCSDVDSVTITISDVANGSVSCGCTGFNGSYVIDPDTDGCIEYSELVVDRCAINAFTRYSAWVDYRWSFNSSADYTINSVSSLVTASNALNLGATSSSKLCNNFTLNKGHYVWVRIRESIIGFSGQQSFAMVYLFQFGNSDIKPGCPDDQIYGLCSGLSSAGIATHVFSQYYITGGPVSTPNCFWGIDGGCDFSAISVLIGSPVITISVTPPPP